LVKDDDDRLPIHWAVAYNRLPVVELLVATKDFDPDVEVRPLIFPEHWKLVKSFVYMLTDSTQDGSGWTPLMIAASLKDAAGDAIIELLLRKGADVSIKSNSGQVSTP
jgi:26S proteasome non-ATPase regulatory subunit 10